MKFISLSSCPSYGEGCTPSEAERLNATLRRAAEAVGITVFEGDSSALREARENEQEIDWFAKACEEGWDWPESSWFQWFASRLMAPLSKNDRGPLFPGQIVSCPTLGIDAGKIIGRYWPSTALIVKTGTSELEIEPSELYA